MAFTKGLNRLSYSPFALDVLLYYNYKVEEAFSMYRTIQKYGRENVMDTNSQITQTDSLNVDFLMETKLNYHA